jgi:hypothetical protein
LLRRAIFTRQTGGQGSDNDTTDETLGKGRSTASQRGGDDDRILLGLFLMQRALPATMVADKSSSSLVNVRSFRQIGPRAILMNRTIMAVSRGGDEGGKVRRVAWADGESTARTAVMMMIDGMRAYLKRLFPAQAASRNGRRRISLFGRANIQMNMMMVMMFKTKILTVSSGPVLSKSTGLDIGTTRLKGMTTRVRGGAITRVKRGSIMLFFIRNLNRLRLGPSSMARSTCSSALYADALPTTSAAARRRFLAPAAGHEARRTAQRQTLAPA